MKPRAFSKGRTRSELTITPIRRALAKSRNQLVFGHCPQTLKTRVVRMLYLRNMEHLGYNIRCDHYVRTSNTSMKERY